MLHLVRQAQPGMSTALIDRHLRRRKIRVRKRADRHGDKSRHPVALPAHGGPALAAEPAPGDAAAVAGLPVFTALPPDRHRSRRAPRLHSEHAPTALLARVAWADRTPSRPAARLRQSDV